MPSREVPKRIGEGFEVTKKLGEGSFGEVYQGIDKRPGRNNAPVAIKFEPSSSSDAGSLRNEARLLDLLRRPSQRHGFAEMFHFSPRQGAWSVLVMDLLGKSLEDCVEGCNGKLTAISTTLVAEQVISRLEYLHSKGIVHRDIKPENFMCGLGRKAHHLYLIDFGLSVKYFGERGHARMSRQKESLTGTARYASVNAHKGCTQSRRDDLEAIGHMLLYFLRGSLPWSGLKAKTQEEKFRKIAETKEHYDLQELGKGFPKEFVTYLDTCRRLGFEERPNYKKLRADFRELRKSLGVQKDHSIEDWEFEWMQGVDKQSLIPLEEGCVFQQPDEVEKDSLGRSPKQCFACWSTKRVHAPAPIQREGRAEQVPMDKE